MDFLQLEHFLAVVDEGSFTRAAERVYRTQSAISQSIKKLEEEVGAPLFARDMPEVCLTQSGQRLVDYARRMIRLRDNAMKSLDELRNLVSGSLSIAAHESAAVYLLPGPIKAYLRRFPEIKVNIYRNRLDEIPRLVMDREVDVGFVKEEPTFKELRCVQIHLDEMVLIAPPHHPLAVRPHVTVKDLSSEHFVLHHVCAATTQHVLRLFEEHGSRCKVAAELWSFENIKQFVREDVGLAIVPRVCVQQELADGLLAAIPIIELRMPRPTRMIFRDRRYVSDAARELISIVSTFNWDVSPQLERPRLRAVSRPG
jgi:DNA-binding transcriptional LysR family regulator